MHPLLRYTLDLFESLSTAPPAQAAPAKPAARAPLPAATPDTPKAIRPKAIAPKEIGSKVISQSTPALSLTTDTGFTHPQATRSLRLQGVQVAFSLVRARRRSIGMRIGPDGLSVRAPRWTSLLEIDQVLQARADWIVRKLHESREQHAHLEQTRIDWRDGAIFPYLGGQLRLRLDPAHGFSAVGAALAEVQGEQHGPLLRELRIALPLDASAAQIRDATQAWLMRQAKALFEERLKHFAPQLQVQWTRLSLSNADKRWGSAKSDGSIRLNWRLMHFELPVIDYVVAHELSHLRVMNHSPRFWQTVGSVMPDYPQQRKKLKDPTAPLW
jgi:predicted metal-dependent hydrolase